MSDFFRYPHTPHLVWLGEAVPRDDKILSEEEVAVFLNGELIVEEKLDGANLGISLAADGSLRAQNRGQYLTAPFPGQFARLSSWLDFHELELRQELNGSLIVFGEWCAAKHSLAYDALPDWWVVFDVYDQSVKTFWSAERRNEFARRTGLAVVPQICQGSLSIESLKECLSSEASRFGPGRMEGVVLRKENAGLLVQSAKIVRPDFTQAITTHWRKRPLEWNRLSNG